MSAIFDAVGSIFEVLAIIVDGAIEAVSIAAGLVNGIFDAVGAVGGVLTGIVGAMDTVGGGVNWAIDTIGTISNRITTLAPSLLQAYIGWFAVQLFLVALFPQVALFINAAFFLYTLLGLWQGVEKLLGASTIVAMSLALFALLANLGMIFYIN